MSKRFRNCLFKLDKHFFSGLFSRLSIFIKLEALFLQKDQGFKITSYYKRNEFNYLAQLCDLYGSDKGEVGRSSQPYPWDSHTYTDYYSRIFSSSRYSVKSVLEVGIGTNNPNLASTMQANGKPGASLRVWRNYFPNAVIYGADIDRDVLFEEPRIKTFYMNQVDSQSVADFFTVIGDIEFDIIFDDGLHTFEAGSVLFTQAIERLSNAGTYIIEDVTFQDLSRYKDFFAELSYDVDFVTLHRPKLPLLDNILVVVKKFESNQI